MTTKTQVLNLVENHPGIHFRELLRKSELALGQLQYHLNKLIKEKSIFKERLLGHVRHFDCSIPHEQYTIHAALWNPSCNKILTHLLEHEGNHCSHLLEHIKLSNSTLSWHIKRLESVQIIETKRHGSKKCIHIKDPELVKKAMKAHKFSILQKSVYNFQDAWTR